MIKKRSLIFVLLCVVFLLVSCEEPSSDSDDPGIDFVIDDIKGNWEFPDQNGDSDITMNVYSSPTGIGVKWTHGTSTYDCYGHGTLTDKVLTQTYRYTIKVGSTTGSESSDQDITITFSYRNDRIRIVCAGEGPLDGKTFVTGEVIPPP